MSDAPSVTVRMYNVGFGDCFLISYPADDRVHRILVDCGTHLSGSGPRPIGRVVERIIEDVSTEDGRPYIDVVIATHRHFDHISGFDNPLWEDVFVGEVWLPWTEHPTDRGAARIRAAHLGLAEALMAWGGSRSTRAATGVTQLAANALSNNGAMRTLLRGFAGRPRRRYLPERVSATRATVTESESATITSPHLPGMQVHVLGPSRDEKVIRDLDPPSGQSYLRLLEIDDNTEGRALLPFGALGAPDPAMEQDKAICDLRKLLRRDPMDMASALEGSINGTSLVLAFELGAAVLLFTGDAQWGTWKEALNLDRWRDLLGRTQLLKIGHHGSHNASPRILVDDALPPDMLAMVSVRPVGRWEFIPKKELLERLGARGARVARSDRSEEAPADFRHEADWWIEADIPA